jgi:hypothetical protein
MAKGDWIVRRQQQERIEVLGLAEPKGPLELHPGALDGGCRVDDLPDWAERPWGGSRRNGVAF